MVITILITIYILCAAIVIICTKKFSKVLCIENDDKPVILLMGLVPSMNTMIAIGMLAIIGVNFLLNYIKDDN